MELTDHQRKGSEEMNCLIPDISVSGPGQTRSQSFNQCPVMSLDNSSDRGIYFAEADEIAASSVVVSGDSALNRSSSFDSASTECSMIDANKGHVQFRKSATEPPESSREGSVERQSLKALDLNGLSPLFRSRDDSNLSSSFASSPSTKGSTDDVHLASSNPRSRTGSISNISAVSAGSGSTGVHQFKKSPAMTATLAPHPNRHNSDASSIASSTGKSTGRSSENKKRGRWYQSLYPTYKQRSEEFKKLFPLIADKERLLIDYSCALQRDILVQGRFYVSQYHICFYAKIIAWETSICNPWKSVIGLTKERTAKIFPNALSYTTDHEQYYFTSFGQRDKTFTNLYRIWQGALKDQPMSTQEIWSFVHYQYGDELGLTSDDDDYVQPGYLRSFPEGLSVVTGTDEDELHHVDAFSSQVGSPLGTPATSASCGVLTELTGSSSTNTTTAADGTSQVNADISSSSGSDQGDEAMYIPPPPINGQTFIDHEFRIPFDELFLTMFSESKLLKEMFVRRKFLETTFGQWMLDPTTDCQVRHVKYCISIGPKTIRTEERQTLLKESVSGRLHLVDSVAQNHGAPYSDSFSVVTHYVLHKVAPSVTRVRVATEVVFRKGNKLYDICCQLPLNPLYPAVSYKLAANWAVKAILEKGVMDQLRDYMADLKSRLSGLEAEIATQDHDVETVAQMDVNDSKHPRRMTHSQRDLGHPVSRSEASGLVGRRSVSFSRGNHSDLNAPMNRERHPGNSAVRKMLYIILILLLLNLILYLRLWDWMPNAQPLVCGRDGSRCDDKRSDWMELMSRFGQPENANLLRSLNEGLTSVTRGLQLVSEALEELQANLATKEDRLAPQHPGGPVEK